MDDTKKYYSTDEVATLLGLHIRTIRRFIHEGRLKATKVGKQYRIAERDLGKLVGSKQRKEHAGPLNRRRRIVTSTTVDIDAIGKTEQHRLISLLIGAFHSMDDERNNKRFDSIYYEEEGRLRILVNADLDLTSDLLGMIQVVLKDKESN